VECRTGIDVGNIKAVGPENSSCYWKIAVRLFFMATGDALRTTKEIDGGIHDLNYDTQPDKIMDALIR